MIIARVPAVVYDDQVEPTVTIVVKKCGCSTPVFAAKSRSVRRIDKLLPCLIDKQLIGAVVGNVDIRKAIVVDIANSTSVAQLCFALLFLVLFKPNAIVSSEKSRSILQVEPVRKVYVLQETLALLWGICLDLQETDRVFRPGRNQRVHHPTH